MKIYIDSEFKCHTTNPDGVYREEETDYFDGKCDTFIEGYRFIPDGDSWIRSDGNIFVGEMIVPWKAYIELDNAQLDYEIQLCDAYSSALTEIEAAISAPDVSGTTTTIVENRKQNIETCINEIIETLFASYET